MHEREEEWVGSIPVLRYLQQLTVYSAGTVRDAVFCKAKAPELSAAADGSLATSNAQGRGFSDWLEAKQRMTEAKAAEAGERVQGDEVNEVAELEKAGQHKTPYRALKLVSRGRGQPVKEQAVHLVVGTYGLFVLPAEGDLDHRQGTGTREPLHYTTYLYSSLTNWEVEGHGRADSRVGASVAAAAVGVLRCLSGPTLTGI